MNSARMILTTAAATAVLALSAPGVYAAGDDWDHWDSSYSKEQKDPKFDPETYKDKDHGQGQDSGGGKHDGGSWSGSHEKPSGGMHTGGGGLASPTTTTTTTGLAVLAVAGTGLYAARRKKTVGSMA